MTIKFCHISPTPYLSALTATNGAHLILAHLVETDEAYRDYYAKLGDGAVKIMDNSAFEMYKQGRPMYPSEKLIEMARACSADHIVLSDYPGEPAQKTIDAAEASMDFYHREGFHTFFVPQSREGDLDDYIRCVEWGLESKADLIGISILGVPLAFGGEKGNKLQRFNARWHMMNILEERGLLDHRVVKRFHFLGMVDGPNEIKLVKDYRDFIYSWDSSAAVWAGLNGIAFDNSPTGLINGKFEKEVDFNFSELSPTNYDITKRNIAYIDKLAGSGPCQFQPF